VPRDQQQHREIDHLLRRDPVAVGLDRDQRRQQIVAGRAPAAREELGQVYGELALGRSDRGVDLGRAQNGGVDRACQAARPGGERRLVGLGHAEQAADDTDRQRIGERADQVDRLGGSLRASGVE
jgi:hypothetical protein